MNRRFIMDNCEECNVAIAEDEVLCSGCWAAEAARIRAEMPDDDWRSQWYDSTIGGVAQGT